VPLLFVHDDGHTSVLRGNVTCIPLLADFESKPRETVEDRSTRIIFRVRCDTAGVDAGRDHPPRRSRMMSGKNRPQSGFVYLAHFSTKLHHCHHYVGFATDLGQRLAQHRAGTGARLMEVVKQLGIEWKLVRVWPGDRRLERLLKRRKNTPRRLCPVCRGEVAYEAVDERVFLPAASSSAATAQGDGPEDDPPF
jgi:predicted GIY-YIG superfamily endonuclease